MKLPVFATRALKYWQSEFAPTYVGLHHLLANSRGIDLNAMLTEAARAMEPHTHHTYHAYKGADARGRLQYRQCVASGPVTALLESNILTRISQQKTFAKSTAVYSHLWSPPTSDSMFCHFMHGYRARHAAVAKSLTAESDLVAVATDISSCYASIDFGATTRIFRRRVLTSNLSESERETAISFANSLTGFVSPPVGAPIGHVLAQLWLEKLDRALEPRFPGRYARYVDDLVIVCPAHEATRTLKRLDKELGRLGLQRSAEKTVILSRAEWHGEVGSDAALGTLREYSLGEIKRKARKLLSEDPDARDALRRVLRDDGFGICLEPAFMGVANGLLQHPAARRLRSQRVEDIRRSAHVCRGAYLHRFHLLVDEFERLAAPTRWHVQQVRNLAVPLLSLVPLSDQGQIGRALPRKPAFFEVHAVISALAETDPRHVLAYPGPTADRLSALWSAHGLSRVVAEPIREEDPAFDALVQLTLGGVVCVPESRLRCLPVYRRELIRFAQGAPAISRALRDHSYVDELRSLQLGPAARDCA